MNKILLIMTIFVTYSAFSQFGPPFVNNPLLNVLIEWNDNSNLSPIETTNYIIKIKNEALKGAYLNISVNSSSITVYSPLCDELAYKNICFKTSSKQFKLYLDLNKPHDKAIYDAYYFSNVSNRRLASQAFFNMFRDKNYFNSLGIPDVNYFDLNFGSEEITEFGTEPIKILHNNKI